MAKELKITEAGEVTFSVSEQDGRVAVLFPAPSEGVLLSPKLARDFASALCNQADKADGFVSVVRVTGGGY